MIALVGAPGCGKSSVGAELAERLGTPFVDLDAELAVADLVLDDGADALRRAALGALRRAPAGAVVAVSSAVAGGEDARDALSGATTVYLASDLSHTFPRSGMGGPQPAGLLPARLLWRQLLEERDPGYRSLAQHVVEVGQKDVKGVTDAVIEALGARREVRLAGGFNRMRT